MLRIIAGKYKNHIVPTCKNAKYRPTTTKFREALFSIISSGQFIDNEILKDAKVLDLFSGTGILSFEALSRGASSSMLIDIDKKYLELAKGFAIEIGESQNIKFLNLDIQNIPKSKIQYDLVFMDPPYHKNLILKTFDSLINKSWVKEGTIIIAEFSKSEFIDIANLPSIEIISERIYGNSKMLVTRVAN